MKKLALRCSVVALLLVLVFAMTGCRSTALFLLNRFTPAESTEASDDGYVRGIPDDGLSFVTVNSSNLRYYYHYYHYYGISEIGLYVYSSKYNTEIQNGDRITKVNGVTVNSVDEYKKAIADCKVGDEITIEYIKSSNRLSGAATTSITLHEYVPEGAAVSFN